jgi:hypothetical protein
VADQAADLDLEHQQVLEAGDVGRPPRVDHQQRALRVHQRVEIEGAGRGVGPGGRHAFSQLAQVPLQARHVVEGDVEGGVEAAAGGQRRPHQLRRDLEPGKLVPAAHGCEV